MISELFNFKAHFSCSLVDKVIMPYFSLNGLNASKSKRFERAL